MFASMFWSGSPGTISLLKDAVLAQDIVRLQLAGAG